jgi:predicted amidohydrolase YtcJ
LQAKKPGICRAFFCDNVSMRLPPTLSLLAVIAGGACKPVDLPPSADLVLINGGIYTVNSSRGWAQAAAIAGNNIVAVGNNTEVQALIGPDTRVIDLTGRMALPGIHDSHIHPLEGGYETVWCNLFDAESVEAITVKLSECAATQSEWLNAIGLDLGLFGLTGPDNSILEGIDFDGYIFVDGSDGHAALVNDKVLELVGFDEETPDPPAGVIERRPGTRVPNGTVRETARDIVDKHRPPRDLTISIDVMRDTVRRLNSLGITSIVDLWASEHEYEVYRALNESEELTVRVQNGLIDDGVFAKHTGDDLVRVLDARGEFETALIDNDAIKIMVDGVFEGETGAVLQPYLTTGKLGELNHERDVLFERVLRYYDMGLQLHFHTMGDGAVRRALDALEYARKNGDAGYLDRRHSLSHLGLIADEDMQRFPENNAAASFTLVWGFVDDWTLSLEIPALGEERVRRLYPIRSVSEAGAIVVGGSDWNYGDLDPLLSIEVGITRASPFEVTDYEVFADQATDLRTMIDAYTINGAWLTHNDSRLGSLEAGKLADIVVYDRNLFEIPPTEISDAVVDLTIFNGQIVYERQPDQLE